MATAFEFAQELDATARETGMSGAIRLDAAGEPVFEAAYGLADRAHGIPNTVSTRFGLASLSKGFTALTVRALIDGGFLALDTPARQLLGTDLPAIDERVTVEHLLAHTSGIADYLDEEDDWSPSDYVLSVPTHTLAQTDGFLSLLGNRPQRAAPGERWEYSNAGYVVLALIAERAAGVPFHELVDERVFGPAGMTGAAYLRLDELPGDAAVGYLGEESDRTNVLHLPVRGSGDGGAYATLADLSRFWAALAAGRIVAPASLVELTAPRHTAGGRERLRYGAGFWLDAAGPGLILEGLDAGVSTRTRFDPRDGSVLTILSNTSSGAFDVLRRFLGRGLTGDAGDAGSTAG